MSQEQSSGIVNRMINISEYLPHPSNYNIHPPDQVARLAKSLQTFGQVRSVVVWDHPMAEGIKGWFVGGHGIRQAADFLGWEQLRADICPADWSSEQVDAYLVADNELGKFADADEAQMATILERVRNADPALADAAGFDDVRFAELMAKVSAHEASSVDLGMNGNEGEGFADDAQFEEGSWMIKIKLPSQSLVGDEMMKSDLASFCLKYEMVYKIGKG